MIVEIYNLVCLEIVEENDEYWNMELGICKIMDDLVPIYRQDDDSFNWEELGIRDFCYSQCPRVYANFPYFYFARVT